MSWQAWFLVVYAVMGLAVAIKMSIDEMQPSRSGPGKPFEMRNVLTFFLIWPVVAFAYIALSIYLIMERKP